MKFDALIAAGGLANRLGPLPCSKEIYPLTGQIDNNRTKVVCENLIEYYKLAGINDIHFIIRKGKWDIPQLLGDGSSLGINISYLIMNLPFGTPFRYLLVNIPCANGVKAIEPTPSSVSVSFSPSFSTQRFIML